jgi:hypothetical protein
MFGLAGVVTQTVTQVILPVGSIVFDVVITLVVDFILLTHGDSSGQNRGYFPERRS